jgi:two-component system phosphate regulon sensor histidine kinase PhoR
MFSFRNSTPRQISLLTAFLLAIPESLILWWVEKQVGWAILCFVAVFGISYLLISFMLERFVYRQIKLIYKFIYKTKATRKEETYYKYLIPKKTIEEVGVDVENWAAENEKELELLRHNEQFRREFLQNLSHEFKTPVFAIQGYIDTLLDGALANPETAKRFLERASKNVERLSHLLTDLDQIAKLERGEIVLAKEPFVIQELIREVYDSKQSKAEAKEIRCLIKKDSESPVMVFADREKIRQVLSNLVSNAIKYGKQGGEVVASIYRTDGKRILIEITDDGVGIPEADLPRVFERFFRTEAGRSMDLTGSGLGLAICKHILEAHGQTIHARSTEQVGTTFGFTLETAT